MRRDSDFPPAGDSSETRRGRGERRLSEGLLPEQMDFAKVVGASLAISWRQSQRDG